jgi:capsular polysaccharide biosynthesis protein
MFVFRMSGHSTYHLWENNLGPFYATLLDSFDLSPTEAEKLKSLLLDPSSLRIAFVDHKPRHGPKEPKLLDQLLRLFTNVPLLNASMVSAPTCVPLAVVGWSASRFPHKQLVREVQKRWLGIDESRSRAVLPPEPQQIIYISRNHPSVTRGRKMVNEAEVFPVLNQSVFAWTGVPVRKVFMEDLTFKDQIALASRTHIMLSPHGGGVANCIWMSPGTVVVEFVAPVGKTLPGMYHTMCSSSGVHHFHFLADGDPKDANIRDNPRLFSNLIMPVDRMLENAKKGIELYRANARRSAAR